MLCMQKLPLRMGSLKWDTNICKKKKIIYFQKIPMKIFLVESKKDPTLPEVSLTAVVQSSHTTLSPLITNETQQQPACSLRLCLLSFLCPRQNSLTAICLKNILPINFAAESNQNFILFQIASNQRYFVDKQK